MKEETKKDVEETTPSDNVSTDESKTQSQEEDTSTNEQVTDNASETSEGTEEEQEDDWTPPSRKEWETTKKKAEDFEKSIALKRLAKSPAESKPTEEGLEEKVVKLVEEKFQAIRKPEYENNLTSAYKEFIDEHPWANEDAVFKQINSSFDPGTAFNKEDILARIKIAAQNSFPEKYVKATEERIKARVMSGEHNIQVGEGGSGPSVPSKHVEKVTPTKEDIAIANKWFGGDVERYLKNKDN